MSETHVFKTNYIYRCIRKDYNPLTPDKLIIDDRIIEHRRRKWYLIAQDKQVYHFQNIIGIDVSKSWFGADVVIQTVGAGKISIRGFSKSAANEIVYLCKEFITMNTQRDRSDAVVDAINRNKEAIVGAIGTGSSGGLSIADELGKLKDLLDNGLITRDEFDQQKRKLM